MAEKIITVILMIPLFLVFIWTYKFPEESILFGRRWMYKKEPELSNKVIRYTKFSSVIAMLLLPIIMINFFLKNTVLMFVVVILLIILAIGALKIFTDTKDE